MSGLFISMSEHSGLYVTCSTIYSVLNLPLIVNSNIIWIIKYLRTIRLKDIFPIIIFTFSFFIGVTLFFTFSIL